MCAVHDGRCSPWVMCSVVSGNQIHDNYFVLFRIMISIKTKKIFSIYPESCSSTLCYYSKYSRFDNQSN